MVCVEVNYRISKINSEKEKEKALKAKNKLLKQDLTRTC